MEKQYHILQKYNSEVGTDGKVIEQAGKPIQVKDKYITNVFKSYFLRAAKIAVKRRGNMTVGRELKNKSVMKINDSLKWYFYIKASCTCLDLKGI